MTKNALKAIVKECLVEILTEGLSAPSEISTLQESITRSKTKKKPRRRSASGPSGPQTRTALDHVRYDDAVQGAVGALTDDPMMTSIFQDTATSTLQEQMNADRPGHNASVMAQGDQAAKIMASSDPTDIFSGASANWASIAFAGTQNTE